MPRMSQAQFEAYEARRALSSSGPPPPGVPPRGSFPKNEGPLHDQIIDECKRRGWLYFHGSMSHSTYRTEGEPDFSILAPGGVVYWVEAKSKTGKPTTEQLGVHAWMRRLGHQCHIVRSIADFIAVVDRK